MLGMQILHNFLPADMLLANQQRQCKLLLLQVLLERLPMLNFQQVAIMLQMRQAALGTTHQMVASGLCRATGLSSKIE
jgi:hypothetical protein